MWCQVLSVGTKEVLLVVSLEEPLPMSIYNLPPSEPFNLKSNLLSVAELLKSLKIYVSPLGKESTFIQKEKDIVESVGSV